MYKFLNITNKSLGELGSPDYHHLWLMAKSQGYDALQVCVHSEYTKAEDRETKFHAIFSSDREDRHGDVVHQEFDLKAFKKNPVFLDSHNYGSIERIIGRVSPISVKDGKLQGDIEFFMDNPLGALAAKAAEQGFLGATSIGFIPREFNDKGEMLKSELLEVSAVSVPANPDAVFDKAATIPEKKGEEFPEGKEHYCPQCYFENGIVVLRSECEGHEEDEEADTQTPEPQPKSIDRKAIAAKAIQDLEAEHKRRIRTIAKCVREIVEENRLSRKREIYKRIREELNS